MIQVQPSSLPLQTLRLSEKPGSAETPSAPERRGALNAFVCVGGLCVWAKSCPRAKSDTTRGGARAVFVASPGCQGLAARCSLLETLG